ncbi:MAG: DUF2188 domain-containing protein [Candidatus Peribacteraceae bacterium]|nr:DUF2188 domain-containing protein [Candidatus Peribacteraceae bacterium]MDD5074809.1 DUF2188 domain-containing protein [Candidatus Peribacteraceae bacterium]
MTPKRTVLHVVKDRPTDMWETLLQNSKIPMSRHHTQEAAIEAATAVAKHVALGQVKIHRGDNNRIREEHTYGKDPEKYPG